jgi:hypothetical protein
LSVACKLSPLPCILGSAKEYVNVSRDEVVGQFAVAPLSERRNSLRIRGRRSETAATEFKLTYYPRFCQKFYESGMRGCQWWTGKR